MHKTVPARIKAAGTEDGLAEGQFRALVSVFGNKDAMGDVVVPGAFTETLAQWAESGDRIPVYWSHQMADPDFNVGWVDSAHETADGLEVVATLDLDPAGTSKARQVYRLLKGRRVTQFSFAYEVQDGADTEDGYELRKLKLYELGPTPIGANDATQLLGVKGPELVPGRALTPHYEQGLRDALDALSVSVAAIKNVLGVDAGASITRPEKASDTGPATAQEPHGVTAQEPSRRTPVTALAAHLSLLDLEGDQT